MLQTKNSLRQCIAAFVLLAGAIGAGAQTTPAAGGNSPSIQPGFSCPAGMQWSVNTPIPSCVPSVGGTNSPIPCNGGTLSWTTAPGVVCEGPVSAALNGVTSLVTASNGRTGSSSFTCANGTWSKSGAATCVSAPCSAGAQSWTVGGLACSGAAAAMTPGGTVAVTSTNGNQGSAQFTCDPTGAWGSVNPGATCSQSCAAKTVTWSGASFGGGSSGPSCSGSLPAGTPGQSVSLTSNTSAGVGNSTWTCSSGVWSGGGSCAKPAAPPAAAPCDSGYVYWHDAARTATCMGSVPTAPSGYTAYTIAENASVTGSASVVCGSDGSWGMPSGTCSSGGTPPPPPSPPATNGCTGQQMYWNVGGYTCSAYASSTSSGNSAYLTASSGTTTGSAQVTCSNGAWGTVFNKSCSAGAAPPPPAAANCPAGNQTWMSGGNACVAYAPSTPAGGSAYLSDTTAPTTGTGSVVCGGSGAWGVASGSCDSQQAAPPATQGCPAQTVTATQRIGTYGSFYAVVQLSLPQTSGAGPVTVTGLKGNGGNACNSTATVTATFYCSGGTWGGATNASAVGYPGKEADLWGPNPYSAQQAPGWVGCSGG